MSKIDELIAEYCPDGVSYRKFGEIATIQRGASPRPIQNFLTADEKGVPWIKIGDTKARSKYVTNTAQRITVEGAQKSRILKKGDFIMSNSMSYGRPYILGLDGAIHDGWASISEFNSTFNSDFLYHFLTSNVVQNYWDSKINSGSVSNLNADIIKSLSVPILPLPVQEEIVSILDKFTALEAELEAELEARTHQYEYYRNKLLSFKGRKVEWKTLGEIAIKISSGGTPNTSNSLYYNGDIPWLRTQEVGFGEIWDTSIKITSEGLKNSSAKMIPKNCVIIAMYGATVGRSAINKIPVSTNQACANIQVNPDIVSYKFVFYWVKHNYERIKALGTGSQTNINAQTVKDFDIPVPPIEEQERIVAILDKFDALVNDISTGLPAEIQARRQQYEYYRSKLLTFKPLTA